MTAIERIARKTLDLTPRPKPANEAQGDVILTVTIIILIVKIVIVAYECWRDHHAPQSIVWNPASSRGST